MLIAQALRKTGIAIRQKTNGDWSIRTKDRMWTLSCDKYEHWYVEEVPTQYHARSNYSGNWVPLEDNDEQYTIMRERGIDLQQTMNDYRLTIMGCLPTKPKLKDLIQEGMDLQDSILAIARTIEQSNLTDEGLENEVEKLIWTAQLLKKLIS